MLRVTKILLFRGLMIFSLTGIRSAHGYEYSVRHAFCSDYARARSYIGSNTYQYDLQRAYNSCMQDANRLIRNHEASKGEARERAREASKRYQRQRAIEERNRKEEEQRILQLESEMEDYFR